MSDIDRFIISKKASEALKRSDGYECFVDGPVIGMGDIPVPCVLRSVANQTAKIIIADGQDTGVEMSVPLSSVAIVGGAKMEQAAKRLFRS